MQHWGDDEAGSDGEVWWHSVECADIGGDDVVEDGPVDDVVVQPRADAGRARGDAGRRAVGRAREDARGPTNALCRWVLTLNNPSDEDCLDKWLYDHCKSVAWQFEKGDEGTLHIQGAFWLKTPARLSALRKLNSRAHYEPMKASWAQAVAYCSKSDTRVSSPFDDTDGPYFHGTVALKSGQGARNDLQEIRENVEGGGTLLSCFQKHFATMVRSYKGIGAFKHLLDQSRGAAGRDGVTPLEIHGYWGPPGTGKSTRVLREANARALEYGQQPYWLSASQGNGTVWWDGYDNQRVLVLDEMTPGWFKLEDVCRVFQPLPYMVQTKGGSAQLAVTSIWFTTNLDPQGFYAGSENQGAWLRRIEGKLELMSEPWQARVERLEQEAARTVVDIASQSQAVAELEKYDSDAEDISGLVTPVSKRKRLFVKTPYSSPARTEVVEEDDEQLDEAGSRMADTLWRDVVTRGKKKGKVFRLERSEHS